MRRVRTDVSHRIRRRTSIFAARWFRLLLASGVVVILALLVVPTLVDRMGVELPRGLTPLLPWVGRDQNGPSGVQTPPEAPPVAARQIETPAAGGGSAGTRDRSAVEASAPVQTAAPGPVTTVLPPIAPKDPMRPGGETAGGAGTGPGGGASGAGSAARVPAPRPVPADDSSAAKPGKLTTPPSVYWVQVGAFQDARNAERLVARLRGDGLPAATTVFEQSRVQYRVFLAGPDGGSAVPEDVIEKVRGLGFTVETVADGSAVTGLVPLRRAVETSHTLRQQGVRVRLKQEVGSSTYRVVRVGSFPTSAEAEATQASLAGRGIEGVVVRER